MKKYLTSFIYFCLAYLLILSSAYAQESAQQATQTQSPKPYLLIGSYRTTPDQVSPGEEFTLHLEVKNESKVTANNIFLTLGIAAASSTETSKDTSSTDQDTNKTDSLTVLGTSNARFIPVLKGKAEAEVSFRLISSGESSPGVYSLEIKLEYANSSGNSYTSSQTIGVVIKRKADLRIVNLKYPKTTTKGKEFTVSAEVINQSNFSVSGVSIELESGHLEASEGYLFIGVLEAGDSDTLEVKVVAKERGQKSGTIVVKYKDDFGQEQILSKEIKIKAKPAQSKSPVQKSPQKNGFFARIWAFFKALLGLGGKE